MTEKSNGEIIGPRKFPLEFMWGSATAPFQIEGDSGRRSTDWDSFIKRNKIVSSGEQGPNWWVQGNAEEDFRTMKGLGLNAQRLGFEWGRIQPEAGKISTEAIKRYRQMIDFLKGNGMTPMVSLNHFVLPEWVARQGGWENKSIREAFRHYAEVIADKFPDVPYWLTINEPNVLVAMGYLSGYWPPEKKAPKTLLTAYHSVSDNLVAAHDLAGNELTRQSGSGKVGIANNVTWFKPEHEGLTLDKLPVGLANAFFNYNFLRRTIKNSDFAGINFYTGYHVKFRPGISGHNQKDHPMAPDKQFLGKVVGHKDDILSEVGWPIVPGYFLEALQYAYDRFKKPVIITENGIADREDKLRSFYILTHLIALHEAVERGVDVRGYFHWSTVDNLEWREGFGPRFGLIARDPKTGERAIRQSAELYGEIARSNEIDVNRLQEKYLTDGQKELTRKFLQSLEHSV